MNKKSVLLLLLCHAIWGFQPLFWALNKTTDAFTTLAFRIIWSVIFTVGLMAYKKQLHKIIALFKDWRKMRFLFPAAMCMLADWGIFIYAVQYGHVLDTSLGYFISPLITMLISFVIFKEKMAKLQLVAIGLAVTGFVICAVQYGSIPVISIVLALLSIYTSLKKLANVEPLLSIAAETIMMLPFALAYLLFFKQGGIQGYSLTDHLFFAASGIVTAVPMTLYAVGINALPLLMVGFSQYISPSLSMFCGLFFLNESIATGRLITFLFVWAGIAVYMINILREEKKKKEEPVTSQTM